MRYNPAPKDFYVHNRKSFARKMLTKSVAVFNSNDITPTNADGVMPFRQNNDLFYLTGIDQEETVLLMMPDYPVGSNREILFIKETSDLITIWEGYKLTKQAAVELSGIENVFWVSEFEQVFNSLVVEAENIYLSSNEHTRAVIEVESREERFSKWCRSKYPIHNYVRSAPIMHQLRSVKNNAEIEMLQRACDITEAGFRRILKYVKPGVKEFEIEAEFIHEFIRSRSMGFAYQPIIAGGSNACILHYTDNNNTCDVGDMILMDVGAEYGNYNADMSRTIPVSGKFSARQKDVYSSVLKVQRESMEMLRPGIIINDYHREVAKVMENELIGLGLIDRTDIKNQDKTNPLYKKYFMHGTSHYLGLDVHDVGNFFEPISENMVFTVEPGIYIKEEKIGIRLEDNVVIKNDGVFNLMRNIPIEVDEIEELMNE
jgi:Xaa-Pro aminopeptidase